MRERPHHELSARQRPYSETRLAPVTRRGLLAASAGLVLGRAASAALPGEADLIRNVEAYLNGVRTLKARFDQLGPEGDLARGTVWLSRPGRMRFSYDAPSRVLLIATDWRLIFADPSVEQVSTIPLRETPLSFLLADRVELSGDITVTDAQARDGEIGVRLIRTGEADQGSIALVFAERPMELRRWTVTDAQGLTTQVALSAIETGIAIDGELFRWRDPKLFGWPKTP